MKNFMIMLFLCFFLNSVEAQQLIEKHIDFTNKESLFLNIQIADSIKITSWNKNEILVKASININDNMDNAAYLTTFDDSGEIVRVTAKIKPGYFNEKNDCSTHEKIYWEIFVPDKTKFSVSTINGNVIITGTESKIDARSISGFIDLTISEKTKADIDLKTISGTIYSNHEMTSKPHSVFSKISDKLNGGGNPIKLETISGDIYFRTLN
jgi:hypothetical protein